MPDLLYQSHSLEKTQEGISGSLTLFENSPVSPFEVGDTFRPVDGCPALTVEKVSIKDNVLGEFNGKVLRQWEVTIEGSDNNSSEDSQTHIKYNFNISADEKSGTMEVINTGDNPSISLDIGDTFSVPGIGRVFCSNVKGSDDYDEKGSHIWSVIYEGTDREEAANPLPETKYSFSIEKNNDAVVHSGSMQITLSGDNPSFSLRPGDEFSLPGLGKVICSKITGNDEHDDNGIHTWTITYEGTDNLDEAETESLPEIKYSFNIEKNGDNNIHTGSMTVVNEGANPSLTIATGTPFTIPGVGAVTCTKVAGSDEYTESGSHIWTVTYEGSDAPEEQSQEETLPETKYSVSIDGSDENSVIHSGTMQVSFAGENPNFDFHVGDSLNLPGIGNVTCSKVSASDDYTDSGIHVWTITYEGSNSTENEQPETLPEIKYNFTIDKNGDSDIHSGTMTVTNIGENPALNISTGERFSIPGIGQVTCVKVTGSDEFYDSGSHVWTVTYEGSDAPEDEQSQDETLPEVKYNFSIEGENNDSLIHSGTVQVVNTGNAPAFDFGIGRDIDVPGIGKVKCTKINGSDDYSENGTHIWTVTYEGTDAVTDEQSAETLPEIKYSFSVEGNSLVSEHSGSMQVVNEGDNPAVTLAVGSEFTIPGAGRVKCTKVSGSDEYTEKGTRRWTVTYEGSDKEEAEEQATTEYVKYTFSAETSGDNVIHSGSKQVVVFGDNPVFVHSAGDTFSVPGAGNLTCTKYNGSDEFTDDGRHKWTITYEGSDAPNDEQSQDETLPETKYNLAIEKDNDGDIQKSGSMSVVSTGDSPTLNISVGATFRIPGIGDVTCSKITANDDYTEAGTHRWTMTYEGYLNSEPGGDDNPQDDTNVNAKYSFSLEQDSSGGISHSGSIEITTAGDSPSLTHQVGDTITLPGIGEVTCTKVSGADSYSDTGKRKCTVTYEGSDKAQSEEEQQNQNVKYTINIENNSDGVTVYSGSKEIFSTGEVPTFTETIGGTFTIPLIGEVVCTRIHSTNDDSNSWSVILEGSRYGDSSSQGESSEDHSLPETEITTNYELNGNTVRSIAGELLVLRRSASPILKKNIVVYNNDSNKITTPGNSYEGGIAISESITQENIKENGVIVKSYYKHNIEVEL